MVSPGLSAAPCYKSKFKYLKTWEQWEYRCGKGSGVTLGKSLIFQRWRLPGLLHETSEADASMAAGRIPSWLVVVPNELPGIRGSGRWWESGDGAKEVATSWGLPSEASKWCQAVVLEKIVINILTVQVWLTTSWKQSLSPAGPIWQLWRGSGMKLDIFEQHQIHSSQAH